MKYKPWKYKPRTVGRVTKETCRWRVSTRGAFIRVDLYGCIFMGGYINHGNINRGNINRGNINHVHVETRHRHVSLRRSR